MKKLVYAAFTVALFCFISCSKEDNNSVVQPTPIFKQLAKSSSTEYSKIYQDTLTLIDTYEYNSDGYLIERKGSTYKKAANDTAFTHYTFAYTPNLLSIYSKNKHGKIISTYLCHLDKNKLMVVDSSAINYGITSLFEYDEQQRLVKSKEVYTKSKELLSVVDYTYFQNNLIGRKEVYIDSAEDEKTEYSVSYFYDKEIPNTLSNAHLGKSFNGKSNPLAVTSAIGTSSIYKISTGELKSSSSEESRYSYVLDKDNYIVKKGYKYKDAKGVWNDEVFTTYEYVK